jgi:hypothetical protein
MTATVKVRLGLQKYKKRMTSVRTVFCAVVTFNFQVISISRANKAFFFLLLLYLALSAHTEATKKKKVRICVGYTFYSN